PLYPTPFPYTTLFRSLSRSSPEGQDNQGLSPRLETQPPGHDDRLHQHSARQLRRTLPPLHENDWHLADPATQPPGEIQRLHEKRDRKSTRLNSSHVAI